MGQHLSFSIDPNAIGMIHDFSFRPIARPLATAFVFMRPSWIVTAKHVVMQDGLPRPNLGFVADGKKSRLHLLATHPEVDLAVLEADGDTGCLTPLYPSWVGWSGPEGLAIAGYRPSLTDTSAKPLTIQVNRVSSFQTEKRERLSGVEDTILFGAQGVEGGCSGGPVFSWSGGVVGVIIDGPIKSGPDQLARATSIQSLLLGLTFLPAWRAITS